MTPRRRRRSCDRHCLAEAGGWPGPVDGDKAWFHLVTGTGGTKGHDDVYLTDTAVSGL